MANEWNGLPYWTHTGLPQFASCTVTHNLTDAVRILKLKDGDLIPVERPSLGDKAATEWCRKFIEEEGLLDATEIEAPKEDVLPWHRRQYERLDPVEFWASVAILSWWAISHV